MDFGLSSPALLFSAISLLLLAYTNRFLAIANLVRQFISLYRARPDEQLLKQIKHFKLRLQLIKYTQALGVSSFILCVVSMFLVMFASHGVAEAVFVCSLAVLVASLLASLVEVMISIDALNIELDSIGDTEGPRP